MASKRELTDAEHEQRKQAARKHGIYAFDKYGEKALTVPQRSRYAELREMLRSEPGRMELREDLTAHVAMICELGFSHLREAAERGESVFEQPVIHRLATYINALARLLDSFPKTDSERHAAELQRILEMIKDKESDDL